jgi:hypothetical protein
LMTRWTTKGLAGVAGLLLIGLSGCDQTTSTADGGLDAGLTLCQGDGCIGSACAKPADCTEGSTGKAAVCWVSTLLDNPKLLPTPDGYCSRECDSDADCGTGKCYTLPNASKRYCMARCDNATTCRKPGYACAFDGATDAICFPSANFDCDPTANAGYCDYGPDKYIGGCVRVAYEDLHGGVCHLQCKLGVKTCPPDNRAGLPAPPQQCLYIDAGLDSRGNITNPETLYAATSASDRRPHPRRRAHSVPTLASVRTATSAISTPVVPKTASVARCVCKAMASRSTSPVCWFRLEPSWQPTCAQRRVRRARTRFVRVLASAPVIAPPDCASNSA